jgi:hypothetical protein
MEIPYTDTYNSFTVPECTSVNNPTKLTQTHCCEVLIDFRTCLSPSPRCCNDICTASCVDVKIDKVCGSKVLLGGVLHKTIKYIYRDCDNKPDLQVKCKDIPFSCYVDFDSASLCDTFKLSGHEVICEFSELKKIRKNCSITTFFTEKDIIKIAVQSN